MLNAEVTFTEERNNHINKSIKLFTNSLLGREQSSNYYVKERNASKERVAKNIFLGKKAEFFVLSYLVDTCNFPPLELDLEIREGRRKGWKCDLPFNDLDKHYANVHVKACDFNTYNYCKDYSWTFQYGNKNNAFGRDDLFDSPGSNLVALVYLPNPYSSEATIKAILLWKYLKDYLKDPIKASLKGIKKCLYYEDISLLEGVLE
jgi:hypothetical protein